MFNPKSFRHFAALTLTGSKTDPVDSALLAEYAQRMEPALWQAPDNSALALRDIGRQINRLVFACTQAKNRLHALMAKQAFTSQQNRQCLSAKRVVYAGDDCGSIRATRQGVLSLIGGAWQKENPGDLCGDAKIPDRFMGVYQTVQAF